MKKVDYTYINARSDIAIQGDSEEWQNMGYIYQQINQLKKELRIEKDATKTKSIEDIIEIYEARHEELLKQMHLDQESIYDNSIKSEKKKDEQQKRVNKRTIENIIDNDEETVWSGSSKASESSMMEIDNNGQESLQEEASDGDKTE